MSSPPTPVIPRRMRAVLVDEPGGPEKLSIGETTVPAPNENELLVRVHATALNRADLMQREGKYPPPPGASPILGLEMAGTVAAVGRSCSNVRIGDRVCGLLGGGGYAEYAVLACQMAIPIPESMSFDEATAIPEVFLTAFQALHWYGSIRSGMRVLIHAGGSGVGTAAIQLVRAAGAIPYVTASRAKHETCLALGAEAAIDYRSQNFAERIADITEGEGVSIIVDFIGAPYFEQNVESLSVDGRFILLATLGGSRLEHLDLRAFFRKRATLIASTLRNRDRAYKIRLAQEFSTTMIPLFKDGSLKAVIDRVYDWSEVEEAHRYMGDNRNTGKIILRVR